MPVPRETLFDRYLDLIARWNGTLNLTSRADRTPERLRHHLQDSLAIAAALPPDAGRLIDLGSGQGFPAIPLAIETGLTVHLVEADRRKAAFLTSVLAQLELNGQVWPERIETVQLPVAPIVTARALADVTQLLSWSKRLLCDGGVCLFLKSETAEQEVAAARALHSFEAAILPTARPPSCLVKVWALR